MMIPEAAHKILLFHKGIPSQQFLSIKAPVRYLAAERQRSNMEKKEISFSIFLVQDQLNPDKISIWFISGILLTTFYTLVLPSHMP